MNYVAFNSIGIKIPVYSCYGRFSFFWCCVNGRKLGISKKLLQNTQLNWAFVFHILHRDHFMYCSSYAPSCNQIKTGYVPILVAVSRKEQPAHMPGWVCNTMGRSDFNTAPTKHVWWENNQREKIHQFLCDEYITSLFISDQYTVSLYHNLNITLGISR